MIKIDIKKIDDNVKLHEEYVKRKACGRLENVISNESYTIKHKNKADEVIELNPDELNYLIDLFGDSPEERERKIIEYCCDKNLSGLIEQYEESRLRYNHVKNDRNKKFLKYILDYNGFNDGDENWNRHKLLNSIGIDVCPYCNRNYISSFKKDIKKGYKYSSTADLDHYYIKDKYPILQLNLYNLVPSCGVCNSKMKGKKHLRHLHPYFCEDDEIMFRIAFESVKNLYMSDIDNVEIEVINNSEQAENFVSVFNLEQIYQNHRREVIKLKEKIQFYKHFGEGYYEKMYGGNILGDEISLLHMWFDFLFENPHYKPLAKFKKDIYKQLYEILYN